jgi:hypothetical protein
MSIVYCRKKVVMTGHCSVEEAEGLLQWLIKHPGRKVDVAGAESLHMAVVQALMALQPVIVGEPLDDFLRCHVLPQLRAYRPAVDTACPVLIS